MAIDLTIRNKSYSISEKFLGEFLAAKPKQEVIRGFTPWEKIVDFFFSNHTDAIEALYSISEATTSFSLQDTILRIGTYIKDENQKTAFYGALRIDVTIGACSSATLRLSDATIGNLTIGKMEFDGLLELNNRYFEECQEVNSDGKTYKVTYPSQLINAPSQFINAYRLREAITHQYIESRANLDLTKEEHRYIEDSHKEEIFSAPAEGKLQILKRLKEERLRSVAALIPSTATDHLAKEHLKFHEELIESATKESEIVVKPDGPEGLIGRLITQEVFKETIKHISSTKNKHDLMTLDEFAEGYNAMSIEGKALAVVLNQISLNALNAFAKNVTALIKSDLRNKDIASTLISVQDSICGKILSKEMLSDTKGEIKIVLSSCADFFVLDESTGSIDSISDLSAKDIVFRQRSSVMYTIPFDKSEITGLKFENPATNVEPISPLLYGTEENVLLNPAITFKELNSELTSYANDSVKDSAEKFLIDPEDYGNSPLYRHGTRACA